MMKGNECDVDNNRVCDHDRYNFFSYIGLQGQVQQLSWSRPHYLDHFVCMSMGIMYTTRKCLAELVLAHLTAQCN